MAIRRPKKEERFKATFFATVKGFEENTDNELHFNFKYVTDALNKEYGLLQTGHQSNTSGTMIETTDNIDFKINGLIFINGSRFMIETINRKIITNAKSIRSNEAFEIIRIGLS